MTTSAAQADAFYREVLASCTVWAIEDSEGFPAPTNSDGHRSMPFWSQQSRAEGVISKVAAYHGLSVVSLPLGEWRERWLPGLKRDDILVGLNWAGSRATGYDSDPDDVEKNLIARKPAATSTAE